MGRVFAELRSIINLATLFKVGPGGYWTKCYYINKKLKKMNQTAARKFCKEMDGNLLMMREKHERDYIHEQVDYSMGSIWLGVDRLEPLDGDI